MPLVLKENQGCPHGINCPYNRFGDCYGARSDRNKQFVCDLITEQGSFVEGGFRSKYDETGKMKILVE